MYRTIVYFASRSSSFESSCGAIFVILSKAAAISSANANRRLLPTTYSRLIYSIIETFPWNIFAFPSTRREEISFFVDEVIGSILKSSWGSPRERRAVTRRIYRDTDGRENGEALKRSNRLFGGLQRIPRILNNSTGTRRLMKYSRLKHNFTLDRPKYRISSWKWLLQARIIAAVISLTMIIFSFIKRERGWYDLVAVLNV